MRGLVGAGDGQVEVVGLLLAQDGELDVELLEVRAGDLLVELLGEHVHAEGELVGVRPEGDLGEDLVGEGAGHDERRVAGSAATTKLDMLEKGSRVDLPQVDETTLGEEDDVAARGHGVAVNLGLDVDGLLGVRLQPGDIDLNIEVTDAAELIRAGATNVQ